MFRANNFTVTMLILLAFTVVVIRVRHTKPLENSWPTIYWALVLFVTVVRPEDTFNFSIIIMGAVAGFLLRFEFMNKVCTRAVKAVEYCVWFYVFVRGINLCFY